MRAVGWQRALDVFTQALEVDENERDSFMARVCADDHEVGSKVRLLFAADEEADGYLEPPGLAIGELLDKAASTEWVGKRVAGFTVRRMIGAGGMGAVYEAEQDRPQRTVALKMMRLGPRTPRAVHRFLFETEVLGRLQHPGIAQIYDAGTWRDEGGTLLPYFAMEYVDGARHLTVFARELELDARLALFLSVCDAVQHGHERGVIHRDLKPENILIDREGRPKVIDFGVARATDPELAPTGLETRDGELVGSVAYMAPEQLTGRPGEADTRADVYALGCVLFELVCGRAPFETAGVPLPEMVRRRCQEDPPRARAVLRGVPHDLESILLMALAREPHRRYGSVSELAADLRRFRACLPVAAEPPSTLARVLKWSRRHPLLTTASSIAGVALLAIATLWMESEAERKQRERFGEALRSLVPLLETYTPAHAVDTDELIAVCNSALAESGLRPEDEALLRFIRGTHSYEASDFAVAFTDFERSWNLRNAAWGPADQGTLHSRYYLARAQDYRNGSGDKQSAVLMYRELLDALQREEEPNFREITSVNVSLVHTLIDLYRLDEAEKQLDSTTALPFPDGELDHYFLSLLSARGRILAEQGHFDEAQETHLRALRARVTIYGRINEATLTSLMHLATALAYDGQWGEAARWLQTWDQYLQPIDEATPVMLRVWNQMAAVLIEIDRDELDLDEAERYTDEVLGLCGPLNQTFGDARWNALRNKGLIRLERGEPEPAEQYLREAVEELGACGSLPNLMAAQHGLSVVLLSSRRPSEAELVASELVGLARGVYPPNHPDLLRYEEHHAHCLAVLDGYGSAEGRLLNSYEAFVRLWGAEHAFTRETAGHLSEMYTVAGRPERATEWRALAEEQLRPADSPDER